MRKCKVWKKSGILLSKLRRSPGLNSSHVDYSESSRGNMCIPTVTNTRVLMCSGGPVSSIQSKMSLKVKV